MSDAKTGLAAAAGALIGGALGAVAGVAAQKYRPRTRYAQASRGDVLEDSMVIGGSVGAVVGAFIGGTMAGNEPPPPQLPPR